MRKNPIKILWLVIGFLAMGIGMIGVALPYFRQPHFFYWHLFVWQKVLNDFTSGLPEQTVSEAFRQFCKKSCHDFENKILYSASGISNADFSNDCDEQLYGRIFIVFLIIFKYVYFFTKIETVRDTTLVGE